MKIANVDGNNARPIIEREVLVKSVKNEGQFALELSNQDDQHSQQRLATLLEKITEKGIKLSQTPSFAELKAYRESVRQFLGEAVGRMYRLHSNRGWDKNGRQKMYSVIKKIDEKMSELTEDIRQAQQQPLKILAKLDSIRGILVDLYM